MAYYRILKLALLYLVVGDPVRTYGIKLPKDVEILDGYNPPSTWMKDSGLVQIDGSRDHSTNGLVKAFRNKRALLYHIKTVPVIPVYEENIEGDRSDVAKKRLQKRDLTDALKMDVSAQYMEHLAIDSLDSRNKREAAAEVDSKAQENKNNVEITEDTKEWIPQPGPEFVEENVSEANYNAEALVDKQNGREARGATKDQWIKLPYLGRPTENEQLSTSVSNNDEVNHRMPRVNFVTQNKGLQTSESRSQRDSIPRSYYKPTDLRTDIYPPPRDDRSRSTDYASYSRHTYYYPDDYRRRQYSDDLDYYDDLYYNQRRDPYYDRYDNRNGRRYDYSDYRLRTTPYDDYDSTKYERPRRIIYYATLPDVVRTPPNVYRYPQYSRYDDDRYYRSYRDNRHYDYYRGGYYPRYPYSALKKSENEGPRDLSASSTANKEKAAAELKRQQELLKKGDERSRDNSLNSHQYPISLSANMNVDNKTPHQTLYHDITRIDSDYHRYDHPSFQAAVDDPYVSRHD